MVGSSGTMVFMYMLKKMALGRGDLDDIAGADVGVSVNPRF